MGTLKNLTFIVVVAIKDEGLKRTWYKTYTVSSHQSRDLKWMPVEPDTH